jgi:DNA-binding GntR family transcriptional regulator
VNEQAIAKDTVAARGYERPSLTDRAYLDLEEMIVTLRLSPGTVLSETALSRMLGIGRTPVREALQRLAREGLVTVLPRRGILVSEFNIKSQLKMLEVRREIERLMARSAAERAMKDERAHFRQLAAQMRDAAAKDDDIWFMRLDHEFNQLVSATARNEYASKAIALMAGLSRRFWFMHHQHTAQDMPLAAERHAQVADAIAAGDAPAAARASDALLDYVESITRAAMDW